MQLTEEMSLHPTDSVKFRFAYKHFFFGLPSQLLHLCARVYQRAAGLR